MESVIDILGKIASIITALLIIFGFVGSMTKKGKSIITNWFKKINEPTTKGILCVLRSDIRKMCRECIKQGYMTEEDFENITEASEAYGVLGGNSYTHNLVKRTLQLDIKASDEY